MQTAVLWVADISTFSDINKISFIQFHDGTIINGLDVVRDYQDPPGTIAGLFSDLPEAQRLESFESNSANIKKVMAYWKENNILKND